MDTFADAATLWASWWFAPAPVDPVLLHIKGLLAKFVLGDFLHISTQIGSAYRDWLDQGGAALIIPRIVIALAASTVSFIILVLKLAKPKDAHLHVTGRHLSNRWRGFKAL